ncbi:MAG: FAD/NAD(P)-binding protein [Candidatus Methanospirareceae archaeon]
MSIAPYVPYLATIESIREEVGGVRAIKTFRVVFRDKEVRENFSYKPGQCVMVNVIGEGESMIAIASSPTRKGYIELGILKMGKVTTALHQCEEGDTIGIRGPYGNGFPVEEWKSKNIIFIGGGIGITPLRSLIQYMLDNRGDYERLMVIYGARSSADLCYREELEEWKKRGDIEVYLSIDVAEEGWEEFVGFVPDNLLRVAPSPENAIAITCGPPIMIKFVIQNLLKLGFKDDQIYTTLERRMKCGIGKCGRCNIGKVYVCKDGPVFSYAQLKKLPEALQ